MKTLISSEKRCICANPDSPFRYFAWPTVTRLPDGTLAMAASGFRLRHICPFGKGVLCYSRDDGAHWTLPAVVMDTPLDDRDCGLTCFGDNRVILTSFNNSVKAQRAWNARDDSARGALCEAYLRALDEDGEAEARYLGATCRISEDGGYTFGPVKRLPVTAPHGPCRLLDGSLLYIGRRFSADDSFDDGACGYIQCWRIAPDGGASFVSELPNVLEGDETLLSCEPHAVHLPDGRIIVHFRVQSRSGSRPVFTVYQTESSDAGKTFAKPRRLLAEQGGSPPHLLLHSSGTLVCAYGFRQPPYGVRVMLSFDMGAHWETDYLLDQTGISADLGYPSTVEREDGSLLTVYYENLGDQSVIMQRVWELPAWR